MQEKEKKNKEKNPKTVRMGVSVFVYQINQQTNQLAVADDEGQTIFSKTTDIESSLCC